VAGYEALRAAVLSGRPEGWRHGHSVLARQGMAAWMAARAAMAPPAAGTTASSPPVPSTPSNPNLHPATALSSLRNTGEIVAVLAQMALAHL
jgi:hypothetical protein